MTRRLPLQPQLLAVFAVVSLQGPALAAPPSTDTFEVTTGVTHSDNGALSATNKRSVQTLRVVPSWTRRWLRDLDDMSIKLGATLERSSDPDLRLNRTDPAAEWRWQRAGAQSEFGAQLEYRNDSARASALDESGQRVSEDTRTTKGARAQYSYQLSERQTAGVTLSHQRVAFDKRTQADYTNTALAATLKHRLSEFTDATFGVDGSEYSPERSAAAPLATKAQRYGATFTVRHQVSEQLEASGQLGVLRIQRQGQDSIGTWQGSADLTHTAQRFTTRFSAGRSSVIDNRTGGYSVSDSASVRTDLALSDARSVGAQFSWRRTDGVVDTTSRTLGLTYSDQLSERWRLNVNGGRRVLDRQEPTAVTEHYLGAQLTYRTPDL